MLSKMMKAGEPYPRGGVPALAKRCRCSTGPFYKAIKGDSELLAWSRGEAVTAPGSGILGGAEALVAPAPPASSTGNHEVRFSLCTSRRDHFATIDGARKPVTSAGWDVLEALRQAGPSGHHLDALLVRSGHTDAVNMLKRLWRKDADWRKVIVLPGGPAGGGYRLRGLPKANAEVEAGPESAAQNP
ncbi:MAG: hypothetical protein NTX87_00340 [Planctomycetota bacterium]|nr:hypothetical protein [Planctomycetota bacterium]